MHRAPQAVHDLARLVVRRPASITNKMMNLEGSRAHAGEQRGASERIRQTSHGTRSPRMTDRRLPLFTIGTSDRRSWRCNAAEALQE